MKTVVLFCIAAFITTASFGQEKSKGDTLYIDFSKVQTIIFTDSSKQKKPVKAYNTEALVKGDVLIATKQYWYQLLVFMKGSKNGDFTQQQTEQLQQPFYEYAVEWEKILQQSTQPKK
ncbi:MAG: hypothetical protein HYU71_06415 [Bacteroidetes bacterium]|nr:hypothetical protein [Bacteroidota bacterium]